MTALSEHSIREHARRAGLEARALTELGAGTDSACYLADGGWVLRFPLAPDAQRTLTTELALLPDLATTLPVSAPRFEHLARDRDTVLLAAYRLLPGAPLTHERLMALSRSERSHVLDQLARFLAALHAYPTGQATAAGVRAELAKGGYHRSQRQLPALLEGTLTAAEMGQLWAILARHEREEAAADMVLLHADLKPDHVLYDEGTRQLAVIDWGDVSFGEPDFELAIIGRFFGRAFLRALLERMPELDAKVVLDRARFFQLLRCAQDLYYVVLTSKQALLPGSIRRFRSALASYTP